MRQLCFQIAAQKYGNLVFLVPNLKILIFCSKLCSKANSKGLIANMIKVFQNCPKHLNKAFLIPNLRILIFARNFAIRQIGRRYYKYNNSFPTIQVKNPNRAFLVPSLFFVDLDEGL